MEAYNIIYMETCLQTDQFECGPQFQISELSLCSLHYVLTAGSIHTHACRDKRKCDYLAVGLLDSDVEVEEENER